MNIEVDNEILAIVIDARFGIKPQLSSNIEKANFKQTIFFPEDKLKSNTFNSVPLDTYGIINKSKLFTREPITGEQISYLIMIMATLLKIIIQILKSKQQIIKFFIDLKLMRFNTNTAHQFLLI